MLSIVFTLKYLIKSMYGVFRNPYEEQIPKLSSGVQFDQTFMEKTWETSCCKLTEMYCIPSSLTSIAIFDNSKDNITLAAVILVVLFSCGLYLLTKYFISVLSPVTK